MMRRFSLFLLLWVFVSAGRCRGEEVYVSTASGAIGHGILREYRGKCYVILPKHVVALPGTVTVVARGGQRSNAELFKLDPTLDLAILLMPESNNGFCEGASGASADLAEKAVQASSDAVIKAITADGSSTRSAVFVNQVTNQNISVHTKGDGVLAKQMSGSVVVVSDVPIGMLISISSDGNVGYVYPQRLIEYFWESSRPRASNCTDGCSFTLSNGNFVKHFAPSTDDGNGVVTTRYDDIYKVPEGWPTPPYFHVWRDKIDITTFGVAQPSPATITTFSFSATPTNRAADLWVTGIIFQTLKRSSDFLWIDNKSWSIEVSEGADSSVIQVTIKPQGSSYSGPTNIQGPNP